MSVIIFQVQSILIFSLILFGVYLVKHRQVATHVKVMKIAMVWDILLILQIELNRGAIAKASKAIQNPMILNIHVLLAISTVVLYALVFRSGRNLQRGKRSVYPIHKRLGMCTVFARFATLATSFMI